MAGPVIVSNGEITKITVHTDSGDAFYHGSVAADTEAQFVRGEGEGANFDSWLSDYLERLIC